MRAHPRDGEARSYDSVVLAGGGSRTFWHAGFWREAAEPLRLRPKQLGVVSASSAIACALFAERMDLALRLFEEATAANPRNVYPENLLRSAPVFPHEAIYRGVLRDLFDDEALARLRRGPDVRVLLAHAPRWLGPRGGALLGLAAYNIDKRIRGEVHPAIPARLGFRAEVVSVRDCASPSELTDLIVGSSCTPPMTALQRWRGRPVLDGGVVDNVPVCALDGEPGRTLVLLSRRYEKLPAVPGRTYVQPSRPVPVSTWEYTRPTALRAAYDLGRRDGETYARTHRGER